MTSSRRAGAAQPEVGNGDVALDELDPVHGVGVGCLNLGQLGLRGIRVPRLHDADGGGPFPLGENPGEQGRPEETREPRHQHCTHFLLV